MTGLRLFFFTAFLGRCIVAECQSLRRFDLNNWGQFPQEVERKSTRRSVLCTLQTNFLIGERNPRWCNASHNPNPDNKRSSNSISKGPLKIGGWKSCGITQKHQKETLGSSNKGVLKWLPGGSRKFPFVFYEIVVVFAQVSSNLSEWHLCPKMQLIRYMVNFW